MPDANSIFRMDQNAFGLRFTAPQLELLGKFFGRLENSQARQIIINKYGYDYVNIVPTRAALGSYNHETKTIYVPTSIFNELSVPLNSSGLSFE